MKCTIEKDSDWREHYREVLFQADPEKLQMAIGAAHGAVQRRICALSDVQPPDTGELTQLAYASHILGLLSMLTEHKQKPNAAIGSAFQPEERLS
jgi:hypothetical protein